MTRWLLLTALSLAALTACSGSDDVVSPTVTALTQDRQGLSNLAAALEATGLADELGGDGPFTLFAPNNAAFAALLDAQDVADVNALVTEMGVETLASVLRYHVVPGKLTFGELEEGQVETLQGERLEVTLGDQGGATLNGAASVVTADLGTANGVVHIVNEVLPPPSRRAEPDLLESIRGVANLSIFAEALQRTGLVKQLEQELVTLFAPTDAAIESLLADVGISKEELFTNSALADALLYHVVRGAFSAEALRERSEVPTLQGQPLYITSRDSPEVNGAALSSADIAVPGGVLHVVDEFLLPPDQQAARQAFVRVELVGDNVVPPVASDAAGILRTQRRLSSPATLRVYGSYPIDDLTLTVAHIHGPAKEGETAEVLFTLDATIEELEDEESGEVVTIGSIESTFVLNGGAGGYSEAEILDFYEEGLLYIDLHSEAHPDGELRGQIDIANDVAQ